MWIKLRWEFVGIFKFLNFIIKKKIDRAEMWSQFLHWTLSPPNHSSFNFYVISVRFGLDEDINQLNPTSNRSSTLIIWLFVRVYNFSNKGKRLHMYKADLSCIRICWKSTVAKHKVYCGDQINMMQLLPDSMNACQYYENSWRTYKRTSSYFVLFYTLVTNIRVYFS